MAFNPNIIVPDISFWQDADETPRLVDFHQMKSAGAMGVIIRAGQGSWIDPDFRYNWQKAKDAGLPRGTYWFYDSRSAPVNQAKLWLEIVGSDVPEMGYWLDLEEKYGGTYRGWTHWKSCLKYLRDARPGYGRVGVYTAPYYWTTYRPTEPLELQFFGSFPLWIANYGVTQPTIPAPWTLDKTFWWQWTSKGDGLKYGAESLGIDLNYFNGTEEEFKSRYGGVPVPPPPGGRMQYKVVWSNGVARRTAPTTTNSYTGLTYSYNQVVEVLEENIPDASDPTNPNKIWVKFADGYFGAKNYPDSLGVPQVRMVKVEQPEVKKVVKGVFYNEDGTSFEMFPEGA